MIKKTTPKVPAPESQVSTQDYQQQQPKRQQRSPWMSQENMPIILLLEEILEELKQIKAKLK